jgi:hypothetical protein
MGLMMTEPRVVTKTTCERYPKGGKKEFYSPTTDHGPTACFLRRRFGMLFEQ